MSVAVLMFPVMFNTMACPFQGAYVLGWKGKGDNLWGRVTDLLIKGNSELSFSGLAKHTNSHKLRCLKLGT